MTFDHEAVAEALAKADAYLARAQALHEAGRDPSALAVLGELGSHMGRSSLAFALRALWNGGENDMSAGERRAFASHVAESARQLEASAVRYRGEPGEDVRARLRDEAAAVRQVLGDVVIFGPPEGLVQ